MTRVHDSVAPDLSGPRSASPRRNDLVLSRAYQRCLLDMKGQLHEDGKLILGDLIRLSDFFGPQYVSGKPDLTLERAVKRQFVIHVLIRLGMSEAFVMKHFKEMLDDDN